VSLVAATYLAPCNRPLYEFVADACGASGLINGGDWRELDSGRVDIAFVCSPPVVWLGGVVEAVAAPVLTDPRFGGKPLYCSEVVVNRDSPFQSLDDLRGARWAINEPSSWSGYWVTLQRIGSWDFFNEVVEAGFHERALQMVASGEVDGAAVDSHVLGVVLRSAPQLAEMLRVVETLGPSPSQPVVVRSGLDPAVKERITRRLLGLQDPRMKEYLVEGFAPAPDYSQIASVVSSATNGWR
jgi:phosphate/phosphite/phosphonate ABC transporter binding protein